MKPNATLFRMPQQDQAALLKRAVPRCPLPVRQKVAPRSFGEEVGVYDPIFAVQRTSLAG
ncbi:MAG: hypothetical protein IJW40_02825 [Clostridia bacterium]|nr:hypothetical protein [Clostridia bacterium]